MWVLFKNHIFALNLLKQKVFVICFFSDPNAIRFCTLISKNQEINAMKLYGVHF